MGMLLSRHYADVRAEGVTEKVAPKPETKVEVEVKAAEEPKKKEISADDIKSMNGAKLRKLAKESGIESPEELTVGELKAILCEKFS